MLTSSSQASPTPVNAKVTLSINGPGGPYTTTLTTGSNGTGTALLSNAPSGTYSSTVGALAATGYDAVLTTPSNSFTKK